MSSPALRRLPRCGPHARETSRWSRVAGRTTGEATFFELERPELGEVSTADPARAAELAQTGHTLIERRMPMVTLAELCATHAPAVIDFLSIDVEGAEADVIAGADWRRFRPRIVIVESVQVITRAATHTEWEPMLLDAGYVFVADDGINRFYVTREEAAMLAEPLARPVSWLDRYEPYEYLAEIERIQAEARAAIAAARAAASGSASGAANGSANGAGRASSVAAQVLAEAAVEQEKAMWAGYEGLRAELVRLRQRVEVYERQLIGREMAVSGNGGTLGALAGPEGIGPIWLALAARATTAVTPLSGALDPNQSAGRRRPPARPPHAPLARARNHADWSDSTAHDEPLAS